MWRNFNVVPGPPSAGQPPNFYKLPLLVTGAFDTGHSFELEAIGRLPQGSRAFLDVPAWLADALQPHPCEVSHDRKRSMVQIPLHPAGVQRLGTAVLHAGSKAECRLLVEIPKEQRHADYDFAIRQLFRGIEVGRLTWRFVAQEKGGRHRKGRTPRS